jgi:hypothetical protein
MFDGARIFGRSAERLPGRLRGPRYFTCSNFLHLVPGNPDPIHSMNAQHDQGWAFEKKFRKNFYTSAALTRKLFGPSVKTFDGASNLSKSRCAVGIKNALIYFCRKK